MLIDQKQGEGVRTVQGGLVNSKEFRDKSTNGNDDEGEGDEVSDGGTTNR